MYLNGDFLGYRHTNLTHYFIGSDQASLYKKNLDALPIDWYYRNRAITYVYNEYGHRCPNIKDVDFDNYILFAGDSHTEGVGLELETTYPYLVAKELGTTYYNLGLGGSGLDVMFYNLSVWLSKYPKPKYISLYYSDPTRFITYLEEEDAYCHCSTWSDEYNIKNMLKFADQCNYFNTRAFLLHNAAKLRLSDLNVPYSGISISISDPNNPYGCKVFDQGEYPDKARDLGHSGIKKHIEIAQYLVADYKTKYNNATVHSTN
jgi:hypothetical protein